MVAPWPDFLIGAAVSPTLRRLARSGGRTFAGRQQRVISDAGFWEVSFSDLFIRDRESVYAYEALLTRLKQGETTNCLVLQNYTPLGARLPNSSASFKTTTALRATEATLVVSGMNPTAGMMFSSGNRLHRITEVVSAPPTPPWESYLTAPGGILESEIPLVETISASADYTVKFLPPLRRQYAAGEAVSFSVLRLAAELRDLNDGDFVVEPSGVGYASLTLQEAF